MRKESLLRPEPLFWEMRGKRKQPLPFRSLASFGVIGMWLGRMHPKRIFEGKGESPGFKGGSFAAGLMQVRLLCRMPAASAASLLRVWREFGSVAAGLALLCRFDGMQKRNRRAATISFLPG